jgi:hypothetical protein
LALFQESNPKHWNEPPAAENVENKCVVEWLRELGLSKYEEIFIREEIDWETLQWLTEEVRSIVFLVWSFIFLLSSICSYSITA